MIRRTARRITSGWLFVGPQARKPARRFAATLEPLCPGPVDRLVRRSPQALAAAVDDPGCPARYGTDPDVSRKTLEAALDDATDRVGDNLDTFYDRFPEPASDDLVYGATSNADGWTTSFWTGLCWLAGEVTGQRRFHDAASAQVGTFRRLETGETDTHDLGFLYSLSTVADHRLTGREPSRVAAVRAADLLADRFHPAPGLIQAWGPTDDPDAWTHGRMIVDTMMNLPLLFWASEATGDPRYADIAGTHARTNAAHVVRPDGSTFHTFACDAETGEPLGGETHQGCADDSCWARGQAWAIYGYALAADYAGEPAYADLAAKLANYYLSHVADDHVPRWDFDAPENDAVRDSSAAAIAACGFAHLARVLPAADERAGEYRNAALATLGSLTDDYRAGADSNGLLTDGAYNRPKGDYDECTIWGDYFYTEGLVRATRAAWEPYW